MRFVGSPTFLVTDCVSLNTLLSTLYILALGFSEVVGDVVAVALHVVSLLRPLSREDYS